MVTSTPIKPMVFARLYLDADTVRFSGKTITFRGQDYVKGIISAGSLERSIALPAGNLRVSDMQLTLMDPDGSIKVWLDETTPLRRLADLSPDLETNAAEVGAIVPVFTAEILDFSAPDIGEVTIHVRDITDAWLKHAIPHLLVRDNFQNMPDDINSAFANIILGRVYSLDKTNVEKQGALACPLVDTTTNDYCVARHECYAVTAVYRKNHLDQRFVLVDPSEYSIVLVDKTIGGILYHFTMIRFAAAQYDGTCIQCDASGVNSKTDFHDESTAYPVEVENPADCLFNLIYIVLQDETNIINFDLDDFYEVQTRCTARSYKCGGAITGRSNSLEVITNGKAIADLCHDFNIDFYQKNTGKIGVKLFDLTLDDPLAIPIDDDLILENTIKSYSPREIKNHLRYRYHKAYTQLPDSIRDRGNKDYGYEFNQRNTTDQTELSLTGANPKLEKLVELSFVRDDATARDVTKKMFPYYTLRSYDIEVKINAWSGGSFAGFNLNLTQAVHLDSAYGFGGGYTDVLARIYSVNMDFDTWDITVRMTVYFPISDGDISDDFGHVAHDVQVRNPQFPVTINGTTPLTAAKSIDLRHDGTIPMDQIPVYWVEDTATDPTKRRVTGYVAAGEAPDLTDLVLCAHATGTYGIGETAVEITAGCLQAVADAIQTALEQLDSRDDTLQANIDAALECAHYTGTIGIGEITTDFTDACIQAVADAIQAALDSLDSRIDTVSADLASFETSVGTSITTIEGEISSLSSSLSSLSSTVSSLSSEVSLLEFNTESTQAAVDLLSFQFASLLDCLAFYDISC